MRGLFQSLIAAEKMLFLHLVTYAFKILILSTLETVSLPTCSFIQFSPVRSLFLSHHRSEFYLSYKRQVNVCSFCIVPLNSPNGSFPFITFFSTKHPNCGTFWLFFFIACTAQVTESPIFPLTIHLASSCSMDYTWSMIVLLRASRPDKCTAQSVDHLINCQLSQPFTAPAVEKSTVPILTLFATLETAELAWKQVILFHVGLHNRKKAFGGTYVKGNVQSKSFILRVVGAWNILLGLVVEADAIVQQIDLTQTKEQILQLLFPS